MILENEKYFMLLNFEKFGDKILKKVINYNFSVIDLIIKNMKIVY